MRLLSTLTDSSKVYFTKGSFDAFLVKVTRPDGSTFMPRDDEFFTLVKDFASRFTAETVWYYLLGVSTSITAHSRVSDFKIPECFIEYEYLICYMIAAMIAEENKANAIIGKRMKLLGLHQVLMDGFTCHTAANWSKGKPWREIDAECKRRGF